MNDDLNVPRALAVAWEALRGDLPPAVERATLLAFDRVFGLGLATWVPKQEAIPDDVQALAEARVGRAPREELGRGRPAARRIARGGLGDGGPARRLRAEAARASSGEDGRR